MQKQAPSFGRIAAMLIFALSCFGILLFLWLSFGGPIPLEPQGYRMKVSFREATTLAQEADVRISGVNVGKVKQKELQKGASRTLVTLELDDKYAPVRADTRAILRQKTLLGETFVELTPGSRAAPKLPEGATLRRSQVEPTVELDEIFQAFDPETRRAFQVWVKEQADAVRGGTGEDLNDALGNLEGFARDGAGVLRVLNEQEGAVRALIRNTGVVFGALGEREGELAQLIQNSNNVFEATASERESLARTFEIFPTFLDESRLTLARLERFSTNTRPLVRDLKPVADDLGPTIRDVGGLAPDLRRFFLDLDPLIRASRTGLPASARFLRGARPVFRGLRIFLPELNPILSFANYQQQILAGFFATGAPGLHYFGPDQGGTEHALAQFGILNARSLSLSPGNIPETDRGTAYPNPEYLARGVQRGIVENFSSCANSSTGGEKPNATHSPDSPPCFVQPPSGFDGGLFPTVGRGERSRSPAPERLDGLQTPPLLPRR